MEKNNKKEMLLKFLLQVESLKWHKEVTVFKEAYSTMSYIEYNRLISIGNILCDIYYLEREVKDSWKIRTKLRKIASKEYLKNKQLYDSKREKIVDFDFNNENKMLIRMSKADIEIGELKDIIGCMKIIKKNGDIVELEFPAVFCVVRGKFYIHESVYKKIRNIGIPQCRIVETSDMEDGREKISFKEWNEESILHMYGYNVSSTENLSNEQRQIILYNIMANNVLKRWQIVDHISFLISLNKEKRNWESAVEKWRKDIEFVNSIEIKDIEKLAPDLLMVKKRIRI